MLAKLIAHLRYTPITLLVVLCVVCGSLYSCERKARTQLQQSYAAMQTVNEANVQTIAELQRWRESLNAAIEQALEDRKALEQLRQELRDDVQQLLKSNAAVREWATTVVPADVVRMYNNADHAAGAGVPGGADTGP